VIVDRDEENTRLLNNVVTELQHIKELLRDKLDQIIANTAPKPSTDIASLGVTVDPPIKQ
jgi:hypothetical protein